MDLIEIWEELRNGSNKKSYRDSLVASSQNEKLLKFAFYQKNGNT